MLHAQALVLTDRPSQYAARIANDLALEFTAEWGAESGCVRLPDGICDMYTWPEGLRLDAFAETSDGLAHVEDLVKRHLEHVSEGRRLTVEWYRRPTAA